MAPGEPAAAEVVSAAGAAADEVASLVVEAPACELRRLLCAPPDAAAPGRRGPELAAALRDFRRPGGRCLLWPAVQRKCGAEEVVRCLVEDAGLLPDLPDEVLGQTPLFSAAAHGATGAARALIELRAKVDQIDGNQQTPLFWAASRGHTACIRELLDARASLGTTDVNGQGALFYAAKRGYDECLAAMLEASGGGAAAWAVDRWGRSALFYASGRRCSELLLRAAGAPGAAGAARVGARDSNEQTALFYAARDGDEARVRLLLESRAEAEAEDKHGQTPLFWAAGAGQEGVCRLLVEEGGADPDRRDKQGLTPSAVAGQRCGPAVAALFESARARRAGPQPAAAPGWGEGSPSAAALPCPKRRKVSPAGPGEAEPCAAGTWGGSVGGQPVGLGVQQGADAIALAHAVRCRSLADVEALLDAWPPTGPRVSQVVDSRGLNLAFWAAARRGGGAAGREVCRLLVERHGVHPAYIDPASRTPLFYAVGEGDACTAAYLLEAKCSPDHRDAEGRTALFLAARLGDPACARCLLDAGAQVDCEDAEGCTALREAAASGSVGVAALLLSRGARPSPVDGAGGGCLDVAGAPAVAALVAARCDVAAAAAGGQAPVHVAAGHGDVAKLAALVAARADVGQADAAGRTALHVAVRYHQLEVCRELLEAHGARHDSEDAAGKTPRDLAADTDWREGVRLFEGAAERRSERLARLVQLVQSAPVQQVRHQLLAARADAHAVDARGRSLLFEAAARPAERGASLDLCRCLVEEVGFDPAATDRQHRTVLFEAAAVGNAEACAYLLARRCDADRRDGAGRSALHCAAAGAQCGALAALLEGRADADGRDGRGRTALFFAAERSPECVRALLAARAAAGAGDGVGQTPLFYAAQGGVEEAVRLLLGAGARAGALDSQGQPALHLAIQHSRAPAALALLRAQRAEEEEEEGGSVRSSRRAASAVHERMVGMAEQRGLAEVVAALGGACDAEPPRAARAAERPDAARAAGAPRPPGRAAAQGAAAGMAQKMQVGEAMIERNRRAGEEVPERKRYVLSFKDTPFQSKEYEDRLQDLESSLGYLGLRWRADLPLASDPRAPAPENIC